MSTDTYELHVLILNCELAYNPDRELEVVVTENVH